MPSYDSLVARHGPGSGNYVRNLIEKVATFDRGVVADNLRTLLHREKIEDRTVSIRTRVDKTIADIFRPESSIPGINLVASVIKFITGHDVVNLFYKPTYSLDDIRGGLITEGINVSAEDVVKDLLVVSATRGDHYCFEEMVPGARDLHRGKLFRFTYHKVSRAYSPR